MSDTAVPPPPSTRRKLGPPRPLGTTTGPTPIADALLGRRPQPTAARPAGTLPAAPSGRMALSKTVSGRLAKPMRLLVYGLEGVGKSTFAAGAPSPIFLGAEDGTSELDVHRFPQPERWSDVMEAVSELTVSPHDYRTLVIDTLDWVEPICWQHVCVTCAPGGKPPLRSIETLGYGKGYVEAAGVWRQLTAALERLRAERSMHVVLLAHSWVKGFKNPAGSDFDRYELKLHKGAAGIWREWCDAVLFAAHDVTTYESDDNRRIKGISSGARVLRTQHDAAWDAKNRYDLPASLPLDWDAFAEAAAAHRPDDPSRLRAQIDQILAEVAANESLTQRVRNAVAAAGDNASELARVLNKLAAKIATTPTDDDTTTPTEATP